MAFHKLQVTGNAGKQLFFAKLPRLRHGRRRLIFSKAKKVMAMIWNGLNSWKTIWIAGLGCAMSKF